ncbi:DUF3180 domain-containing protein [Demequina litorisediminis]|uniref:DUF3180 domain-containing protein n=1 Tax=Demequina litorisediminis TaxID=1849022 RepID=A0ABQ6IEH3_9MICO|nr:DUF3180 domain-containing protein [Demequina litorisediminis]GMA35163.1 hypothetical protein GCM10025876_13670 [Demequina litorisediminis]
MSPLSWQRLTIVALVVLVLAWLFSASLGSSGTTPPHVPWTAVVFNLVAAACALWFGWQVRRFLIGKKPDLSALRAARTVVFGQACAYAGAVLTGAYGGYALGLLDDWSHGPRREVIISALIAAGAALLLVIAGLVAEHWCKHSDEDDDRGEATPA